MGTTRRDFIKDATVVGAAVVVGTTRDTTESKAQTRNSDIHGETERCPYFDQPLLCKGLAPDGKRLCDE